MQPKLKRFIGVIVGSFLGDGSTRKRSDVGNVYMRINHSAKQTEYVKFKHKLLNNFIGTRYNESVRKINDKPYKVVSAETKVHPVITKIHNRYMNGVKKLDMLLLKKLTPEGLSIWYLDDGTLHMRTVRRDSNKPFKTWGGIEIATCSFSYKEHEIIKEYFCDIWNIEVTIRRRKSYYYLYFNRVNSLKFIEIIKNFVPECMNYKINWQCGTTSNWLKRCSELDGDIKTIAEMSMALCRDQGSNYPKNRKFTKK